MTKKRGKMKRTRSVLKYSAAAGLLLASSACTQLIPSFVPTVKAETPISAAYPFEDKYVQVNGARMHYVEVGSGDPVVFIHGNPTSSYLWRNVLPIVGKGHRAIAVDLIGMGQSDKPDIPYRLEDFIRYFDGFMVQMNLGKVTLVVHDWGGPIGIDWAVRHPSEVKGIAMMETIIAPMHWDQVDMFTRYLFRQFRDPVEGQELNVKENYFVEKLLPAMTGRSLTEEERNAYRAPFLKESDRKLVALFPQQIPFDGEPADVAQRVGTNYELLQRGSMPLLLLYAEPGAIVQGKYLEMVRAGLPRMMVKDIGPGIHFIQESQPTNIGNALADWCASL